MVNGDEKTEGKTKVSEVMADRKEELTKILGTKEEAAEEKVEEEHPPAAKAKVITIGERRFEIISENRINARAFEAIAARSGIIMNALDRARVEAYEQAKGEKESPTYKHTIYLGQDDLGRNLRTSISVFSNRVVVQTLREK